MDAESSRVGEQFQVVVPDPLDREQRWVFGYSLWEVPLELGQVLGRSVVVPPVFRKSQHKPRSDSADRQLVGAGVVKGRFVGS